MTAVPSDPWAGPERAPAVRKAFQLIARHGAPEQRAIANDVLSGRHTAADLLYLPDHSGAGFASLHRLADRWALASDEERAAVRADADEAVGALLTQLAGLDVPAAPRRVRPAPDEDEEDFSEERYTGPAHTLP